MADNIRVAPENLMKSNDRSRSPAARASAPPGRVRIIGGQYRRTPIAVIGAPGLRPTPDRVRETVFNWLEHLLGAMTARRALDLFAGTGALGFEMASRGARQVVLVESDARAARALEALQARLGAGAVQVVHGDWREAIAGFAPASFDVIFLDPPFGSGLMAPALRAVRPLLDASGLIYAEGPEPADPALLAGEGLEIVRDGRAGVVYFHLLRARAC